jgi:hypothetical protein
MFQVGGSVRLPLSPPRPALSHHCRALLPSCLTTFCYGALGGPLLGDLLHGLENPRCTDPIREFASRNSPAKAVGQVPGSIGEDAIAGDERLGDQVICECGHGLDVACWPTNRTKGCEMFGAITCNGSVGTA